MQCFCLPSCVKKKEKKIEFGLNLNSKIIVMRAPKTHMNTSKCDVINSSPAKYETMKTRLLIISMKHRLNGEKTGKNKVPSIVTAPYVCTCN